MHIHRKLPRGLKVRESRQELALALQGENLCNAHNSILVSSLQRTPPICKAAMAALIHLKKVVPHRIVTCVLLLLLLLFKPVLFVLRRSIKDIPLPLAVRSYF